MPTDIVSPHNNVISFQIRLRQCVRRPGKEMPTLHASAIPLPGRGHARFVGAVARLGAQQTRAFLLSVPGERQAVGRLEEEADIHSLIRSSTHSRANPPTYPPIHHFLTWFILCQLGTSWSYMKGGNVS